LKLKMTGDFFNNEPYWKRNKSFFSKTKDLIEIQAVRI